MVDRTPFGTTSSGQPVELYRLNAGENSAWVSSLGAALQRWEVPDADGRRANIVLGCADVAGYEHQNAHFGGTIGRVANRIGGARFTLDGETHHLPANDGAHCLHGGREGFDRKVWRGRVAGVSAVEFAYDSVDGEEGFPGNLHVTLRYSLSEDGVLRLEYRARGDRACPVSLTNHSYFNLNGEGSGDILDHRLMIAAPQFLATNADQIPTGERRPVEGTAFDFRQSWAIGARIRQGDDQLALGYGYDHYFVLDGTMPGTLRLAAQAEAAGRRLEIHTDAPGLQFYAGNRLDGRVTGIGGGLYRQSDGFCLETGGFPDAPNQPDFPSIALRPGETYATSTLMRAGPIPRD